MDTDALLNGTDRKLISLIIHVAVYAGDGRRVNSVGYTCAGGECSGVYAFAGWRRRGRRDPIGVAGGGKSRSGWGGWMREESEEDVERWNSGSGFVSLLTGRERKERGKQKKTKGREMQKLFKEAGMMGFKKKKKVGLVGLTWC